MRLVSTQAESRNGIGPRISETNINVPESRIVPAVCNARQTSTTPHRGFKIRVVKVITHALINVTTYVYRECKAFMRIAEIPHKITATRQLRNSYISIRDYCSVVGRGDELCRVCATISSCTTFGTVRRIVDENIIGQEPQVSKGASSPR